VNSNLSPAQLGGAFHFCLNFTGVGQATASHGGLVFFDMDFFKGEKLRSNPRNKLFLHRQKCKVGVELDLP
jgi:hypothetical protein